jgi:hypothetical protein
MKSVQDFFEFNSCYNPALWLELYSTSFGYVCYQIFKHFIRFLTYRKGKTRQTRCPLCSIGSLTWQSISRGHSIFANRVHAVKLCVLSPVNRHQYPDLFSSNYYFHFICPSLFRKVSTCRDRATYCKDTSYYVSLNHNIYKAYPWIQTHFFLTSYLPDD